MINDIPPSPRREKSWRRAHPRPVARGPTHRDGVHAGQVVFQPRLQLDSQGSQQFAAGGGVLSQGLPQRLCVPRAARRQAQEAQLLGTGAFPPDSLSSHIVTNQHLKDRRTH